MNMITSPCSKFKLQESTLKKTPFNKMKERFTVPTGISHHDLEHDNTSICVQNSVTSTECPWWYIHQ
jgi:hypothetical protein